MARTMPKRLTRRIRNWPARRLGAGSTAPSAPSSSKPNCASIRAAALIVLWNAGRSSARPVGTSIRPATCRATGRRARRWGTWREASSAIRNWSRFSPIASGSSVSRSKPAAGSATNWLSPMASSLEEAGASEFDLSFFRRLNAVVRRCVNALARLRRPVPSSFRWRQKHRAGGSAAHARTRPYRPLENRPFPDWAIPLHHLPQDRRGYLPGSAQDQHQWDWVARIRRQPLDRRSRLMASETSVR